LSSEVGAGGAETPLPTSEERGRAPSLQQMHYSRDQHGSVVTPIARV